MTHWWYTLELECGHTAAGEAASQLEGERKLGDEYDCPVHGTTTIARYSGQNWRLA